MAGEKFDAYAMITDKIIAAIEAGVAPWKREWQGAGGIMTPIRSNGEEYKGINVLMLWIAAHAKGYTCNKWYTYKQAQAVGATVRKGEKAESVVYFQMIERENKQTAKKEKFPMLKVYSVFNAEQIDNLPEEEIPTPVDTGAKPIEYMEKFVANTKAKVQITGTQPCYSPVLDHIEMPAVNQFVSAESYYGTLCHELIHWTGHDSRLARFDKHGSEDYAFEELIAEIGACFVTSKMGIDKGIDRSAAYVASWLKALKNDKKFIFKAATQAQRAADYIMECQETK